jgi:hypothetical protein
MAKPDEQNTRSSQQDSMFYERCWRCRCVVPNGLVRRRTLKTGYTQGTHLGTGAAVTSLDHYETVSLCGVCDDELEAIEKARLEKGARRFGLCARFLGVAYGTFILTRIGVPLAFSLTIMLTHAYFRTVGRALLTMHGVTLLAVIIGYPPPRYMTPVMISWVIIWAALIGWQLWFPENRPWPFRKVRGEGPARTVNRSQTESAPGLTTGGKQS